MKKVFVNMKKIKNGLFAITALMLLLACNKEKNPIQNMNAFLPPPPPDCVAPHIVKTNSLTMNFRKVLVEDYTGHTCGNCPRAAENATTIASVFGDSAIILAVHVSNQYAAPKLPDYPEDFRTSTGTDWDNYFGMSTAGLPKGCVNRSQLPFPQPRTTWSVTAGNLLNNPQEAKMLITTALDTVKMLLNVNVKTTFLTTLSNSVSLSVVIAEDSIVASQTDYFPPAGVAVNPPDERPDYEFEHMLRGSLNGSWGDLIKTPPIAVNDTVVTTYNCYQLNPWPVKPGNPKYNLRHTSVIAFIYNTATKVIIQAEKVHIR